MTYARFEYLMMYVWAVWLVIIAGFLVWAAWVLLWDAPRQRRRTLGRLAQVTKPRTAARDGHADVQQEL